MKNRYVKFDVTDVLADLEEMHDLACSAPPLEADDDLDRRQRIREWFTAVRTIIDLKDD